MICLQSGFFEAQIKRIIFNYNVKRQIMQVLLKTVKIDKFLIFLNKKIFMKFRFCQKADCRFQTYPKIFL